MQSPLSLRTCLQNRYQLTRILGQGGFGRTYLAEDLGRFNEKCAIKEWIPPQTSQEDFDKSRELFQREATVLHQIEHRQIPQFHAMFEQDQRLFLVQDYVEGSTYRELLEKRRAQGQTFSEPEVRKLMEQLLPVLRYLHDRGIIHRDISPDNMILRSQDHLPVLIDFGVVKEVVTQLKASGTMVAATTVGKLGYAPSEQMQTGRAYPNSDLYALAVTAIVLLTGHEPQDLFDDRTMTWDWQRFANIRPSFAHLLNRMLSFRSNDRYASTAEVAEVLASLPTGSVTGNPGQDASVSNFKTVAIGGRRKSEPPQPHLDRPITNVDRDRSTPQQNPSSLGSDHGKGVHQKSNGPNPWMFMLKGIIVAIACGVGAWMLVNAWLQGTGWKNASSPTQSASPEATLDPNAPLLSPKPAVPQSVQRRQLALPPGEIVLREGSITAPFIYDFAADKGQILTLKLEGNAVQMTLLGPNQEPVSTATTGVKGWTGVLPFSGTYALRLSLAGDALQSDYVLQASLDNPAVPTPTPTTETTPTPLPTDDSSSTPSPTASPVATPKPTPAKPSPQSSKPPSAPQTPAPVQADPPKSDDLQPNDPIPQITPTQVPGEVLLEPQSGQGKP